MDFRCTFKQMATSDALREYAREKVEAEVAKFVAKPIGAQMTFSVDRLAHHAHLHLSAGDGFSVEVDQVESDMYAAVDKLVDKLEVQLRKQKEKIKAHKHKDAKLEKTINSTRLADEEAFAAAAVDAGELIALERLKGVASSAASQLGQM